MSSPRISSQKLLPYWNLLYFYIRNFMGFKILYKIPTNQKKQPIV